MTERDPISTPALPGGLPFDASQVQFTPAGAGAIARSVQSKERDVVSVLDFYANGVSGVSVDPTGVVDSTLGINAAINSLSVTGGSVYIPKGTYLVDRISIGYSNIRLFGDGTASVLLQKVTASAGPFSGNGGICNIYPATGYTYPAGGATITNVTVEDLWLKGQQTISHTYNALYGGLWADGAHHVAVRRCKFSGNLAEVILITPGSLGDYPIVEDCEIQDGSDSISANKAYGAMFTGNKIHDTWIGNGIGNSGSGWSIVNNKIKNTWLNCISVGGSGFAASVGEENIIALNTCVGASQKGTGNGYGIFLSDDGAGTTTTKTYRISGNIVDKTNSNIGVFSTLSNANDKIVIDANTITGTLTAGSIGLSFNSNGTYYVSGNTILGDANQTFGISAGGGTQTVYISGNTVLGHSSADINFGSGGIGFILGTNTTGAGYVSQRKTITALSASDTDGPLGSSLSFLVRDTTNGGTASVIYENAATPVIVASTTGATTFVTGAPAAGQIQVKNRTGNGGVSFLANANRNNALLSISGTITQP